MEDRYIGLVSLDSPLTSFVQVRSSNVPIDADANPTYRVYNNGSLVASGTLSTKLDSGSITGATNANPIVITSTDHGLQDGLRVTISGVGGNTAANTTATVANSTTDTFELSGVAGNGDYTTGGTWHLSGAYLFLITPTTVGGYAQGQNYTVMVDYEVSSTVYAQVLGFTVV